MDRSVALRLNGESTDSRRSAPWRDAPPDAANDAPYRTPLDAEAIGIAIGRRLRARRRELGVTQKEVGRRAGVSYQQVQRYETGALRISAAMIWKLSIALDVGVPELFGI
jgi:DNA-binding XRE family transcriptional regulator